MCGITKVFCICLLTFGAMCRASPFEQAENFNDEDNEIQRENRQMKGAAATPDQAEVKLLAAGPMLASTASDALQTVSGAATNNLQDTRFSPHDNAVMMQGGYANRASLGYGLNGGIGGVGLGLPTNPAGGFGLAGSLTNYPSGLEMFPAYMYGGGFYPNAGAPLPPNIGAGGMPPLSPLHNYGHVQGLSPQLLAQPSQLLPQQLAPYPVMPGFYPQMGYGPAFQNFQV